MIVKNIVLIISDTFRKNHISIYDNKAKTPNIDEFSKESIVFENAYPESLLTIPARFHEYIQSNGIFTTILENAGIKIKWHVDGNNILRYVKGRGEEKRQYTCSLGNFLMYRDEEYWLIVNRKGRGAQLYYIKEDPMLKRNIANENLHVVRKLYEKILYDAGGIIPELKIQPEESIKWYTINK